MLYNYQMSKIDAGLYSYEEELMNNNKHTQSFPTNEIIFYETENGKISVAVRFERENIWLTQKNIAELFDCSSDNVSLHFKNIYSTKELDRVATTEEFSVAQQEGTRSITRKVLFYNLEAVISVGYRVNSERAIAFRTWATDKLKNYIFKGFAIDSERLKKGSRFDTRFFDELLEEIREIRASERMAYQKITDIYATSLDYFPNSDLASKFFAQGKTMTMKDWSEKLDAFLKFNEQELLEGLGHVSHDVAKALAENEYEKYRVNQDSVYKSDFDKLLELNKTLANETENG